MMATMQALGSELPDEDLVQSVCLGDRAAFGELYNRYARMVHGLLLARVPVSEAEDLVQDVFLSALERLPMLRTAGAFRGWLISIARNRAHDFHRSLRTVAELKEDSPGNVPGQLPEAETRYKTLAILEAIRNLPVAYRETLLLRLVEGMTGPEIARRTGLACDSVRVNLFRGMKLLREQLEGRSGK